MKLLFLLWPLLWASNAVALEDAYCEGFDKGFAQRYCLVTGHAAAEALRPACPDPIWGADAAQDGYNRGFLVGLNAAHRCISEEIGCQTRR